LQAPDRKHPPMMAGVLLSSGVRWSRLSEQIFRVDKWNVCRG
jgi:hypothetical protein